MAVLRYSHKPLNPQSDTTTQQISTINNTVSNIQSTLEKKVTKSSTRGLSENNYSTPEKNKLHDIEDGAEVNVQADWNETDTTSDSYILNKPSVPILDPSGQIPAAYLPSYVDDVLEYNSVVDFPSIGEKGKIYVDTSTDIAYRWSGSTYIEISKSIVTGVKGDAETDYRIGNINLTAANIGLSKVVNLDLSKAIKMITRSGTTFTYTCLDGTTGTFTLQDTVYSLPLAANGTRGGILLGFTQSGRNYPVQLSGEKAYVNVPWTDTTYTLPLATSSTRGGVKVGFTTSAANRNYAVLLSNEQMYVNVPWTDTNTTYTFTDANPTLAWSTKSKVATIGGVDIHVTMPANPNTDTNTWRPVLCNGTSIGSNTLNLKAGSNVSLSNSNGTITITSTDTNTWPTKLSLLTNDPGYITGITKAMVTTALGYTPPTTDHTYNFAGVSFTSGQSGTGEHNANNITSNGVWYYTSNGPATSLGASTTDGALYSQAYSTSWVGQIAQDYKNGRLFVRGKNNGSWQSWLRVALTGESLPASDVYAWAKASTKPSYAWSEITSKPSTFTPSSHTHDYLPLAGGTMSSGAQITVGSVFTGSGSVYNGGIQLRERGYATTSLDGTVYTDGPGITFHWGGRWAHMLNMHSNALYWDNTKISLVSDIPSSLPANGGNADTVDNLHASDLVRFFLSPMTSGAPADSAKSWFTNTMPSASGAIVYNVPGSEKTIIAGKSSGAYGHMLLLNYDDNYLRLLRYLGGSWKTTDWEKISAGYADSAGNADTTDGLHVHGDRNNEANKIVRTDGSGYIQCGWINTTSGNFTGTPDRIWASNDAYMRYMTPANFFPTLANDNNQLSVTVGGQNRKLTIAYATNADSAKKLTSSLSIDSTSKLDAFHEGSVLKIAYVDNDTGGKFGSSDGILLAVGVGSNYGHQIHLDDNNNTMWHRSMIGGGGSWNNWLKVIDSGNIGSQSVNYASSAGSVAWSNVTGKPSTFTPSSHTHDYLPLTGGTLTGQLTISNDKYIRVTRTGRGVTFGDGTDTYVGGDTTKMYMWQGKNLPLVFGTNGSERMRITSDGTLSVGSSNPPSATNSAANLKLYVSGNGWFEGNVSAAQCLSRSDLRLKDVQNPSKQINIEDIANAPVITFKWKNKEIDEDVHIGTSAQYWNEILPEAISVSFDGYLSMDYSAAALSSAITIARKTVEHKEKIKQLEDENKQLKEELLLLKSQIKDILAVINSDNN